MRALLVVNPKATTTSERSRDVLVRALRSEVSLDVVFTRQRGHATALAQATAAAGQRLVVAHGGDGTVNEVVNGLMRIPGDAADRPALAVVPGGSTNVFVRALGVPYDWVEATGVILEALRTGRQREIGLGRADERFFTFCAGLGVDAAVVRQVERARLRGRVSSPGLYLQAAANQLLLGFRRHSDISLVTAEVRQEGLASVIVQNTSPWTYLWGRPIDPNPQASFDLGLDVLALESVCGRDAARTLARLVTGRDAANGRRVTRWHDLAELSLHAGVSQPFQVDGDYVGERADVRLSACPAALRVLC